MASGQLGSAVAGAEGRWVKGDLSLTSGGQLGSIAAQGLISGFALHYLEPFAYDAAGLDLRPTLTAPAGPLIVAARPVLTLGRWTSDAREGTLRIAGGDLTLEKGVGPFTTTLTTGALTVENGVTQGAFFRGGAHATLSRFGWSGTLSALAQRNPLETEVGGGVSISGILRPGVQVHLNAARTLRDPLFGTEGTLSFSAGVAVRPVRLTPPAPIPVVAVGDPAEGGRRVVFALKAPEAVEVALTGDFTGWAPVPMEKTRDGWRLAQILPPGVHHFSFIVDGTWALPPDAPGVIDDGWGQRNASVVVEP